MEGYLIIAELKYTGYVICRTDNLVQAKAKVEGLFSLTDLYPFNEIYKLSGHLSEYQKYKINGNAEYLGKCNQCISNGDFSVYILEIDKHFSLQQFISERQNCSYAVFSDGETEPDVMVYAN